MNLNDRDPSRQAGWAGKPWPEATAESDAEPKAVGQSSDEMDGEDQVADETDDMVVAYSLQQFSKGLWRIFVGCMLLAFSAVVLLATTLVQAPRLPWINLGLIAAVVSAWYIFSGKRLCWSFSLPMQHRYLLTVSFVFDFMLLISRLYRRVLANVPGFNILVLICGFISIWCLLAFVAHLAANIQAQRAKFTAHVAQVFLAIATTALVIANCLVQGPLIQGGPAAKLWAFGGGVAGLVSFIAICVVSATMSVALKQFAHYLIEEKLATIAIDDDEEESD